MKNIRHQFAMGIALGLIVAICVLFTSDTSAVIKGIRTIQPAYIVLACLLSLCNYCLRFSKWHYFTKLIGEKIRLSDSFLTFMAGLSMSVTPGKLGELLKCYILKTSNNIPMSRTTPVVIAERMTDAFGLLLLTGLGALTFRYGTAVIAILAAGSVLFVGLIQQRGLVIALLDKLENSRIHRMIPKLRVFYDSSYRLFSPACLLIAIPLSAVSWGLEAVSFKLILSGLGVSLPLLRTVFIFAFSSLVGAISMLPGGLGLADGSLISLLRFSGLSKGSAGTASLLIRLATLWLAVAVGIIFLVIVGRKGYLLPRTIDIETGSDNVTRTM